MKTSALRLTDDDRSAVRLAEGVTLQYREAGPPDAPALLLLHGLSDSWFSFSRVLDELAECCHVIAPDQRGQGASERPLAGYAMHELAGDAVDILDALGIDRAIVVGHSTGSFVAQHVAAHFPDRASGLVLVGSALVPGNAVIRELAAAVDALPDPLPEAFVRDFQLSTVCRPVPEEFLARAIATSHRMPRRVWQALIAGMLADTGEHASRIHAPTLLVWGDRDAVFSRSEQDALLAAIDGARLEVFNGTGHAPHWEEPARFIRTVAEFARAVSAASGIQSAEEPIIVRSRPESRSDSTRG